MRWTAVLAAAVAAIGAVPAAHAAPGIRFGIQDDAWLTQGPGTFDARLSTLERLGVDLVRYTLRWDQVAVSRAAYDWRAPDTVLEGLRARGIDAVVTLYGTPTWANGGRPPNYAPTRGATFGAFAEAAARRYSWVREWTMWNEPNQLRWLRPTSAGIYVERLLNPGYQSIKRANPSARVGGGVTAPRGNVGGVAPVDWIRGMAAAGAQLDAYAHHPYPGSRLETPASGGCRHADCRTITMANLERLLLEVRRAFGEKRIWLTEYGYQTNPPDKFLGVSQGLQARYLGEAALRAYRLPLVDMLVQYLYRDEPSLGAFQSGLVGSGGSPKLALSAFALPLAQTARRGPTAELWGQVRPGEGTQRFRIQAVGRGRTRWLGRIATTDSRGFLRSTVQAPRGTLVRLWSPGSGFGAPLLLR